MTRNVGSVLLHMGGRLEGNATRLAERVGGAIVTGAHTGPRIKELVRKPLPVLFQHDGSPREEQGDGLFSAEQDWLLVQEGRTSVYTTETCYVPSAGGRDEGRVQGERALVEAIEYGNAFRSRVLAERPGASVWTMVAVHHHWLSRDSDLLVKRLGETTGPVGLMAWHTADPFANRAAIEGMLEVIRAHGHRIGVLRTDLAGLGFRAHGASVVSIGIGTGTRHFSKPGTRGFANVQDKSPRLLVLDLLSFWKGSRVAQVGVDPVLVCACRVCGGQPLERFLDPDLRLEAAEHSVECWASLADQLEGLDGLRREEWWQAKVEEALYQLDGLEERLYLPQAPSAQLESWQEVMGVRAR